MLLKRYVIMLLVFYCSNSNLASKRARVRAPAPKKAPAARTAAARVKKEPLSPPKKSTKRAFDDAIDLSDDNDIAGPEDEDDDDEDKAPGPSTSSRRVPVVEIPRKSTRQSSVASKAAKKVRVNASPNDDLYQQLEKQFDIAAEAFRNIGVAMGKLRGD